MVCEGAHGDPPPLHWQREHQLGHPGGHQGEDDAERGGLLAALHSPRDVLGERPVLPLLARHRREGLPPSAGAAEARGGVENPGQVA